MGFVLLSVEKIDDNCCNCIVKHSGNKLTAKVFGNFEKISANIGKSMNSELGYNAVILSEIITFLDDSKSRIKQVSQNGHVQIIGRMFSTIEIDNDILLDVYIQNGAEFINLKASEMDIEVPPINTIIGIVVDELHLYPYLTNT